jgi:hypothetical protein
MPRWAVARTLESNEYWEAVSALCEASSGKESDIMSRNHLAALLIALAALSNPAAAELRGVPEGPPVFTATEAAVVARNAILSALIQNDPWVVRRLLDSMTAIEAGTAAYGLPPSGAQPEGAPNAGISLDPRTDPDLDRLQRSSPEAVLDLFQLLKQAGEKKPPPPAK